MKVKKLITTSVFCMSMLAGVVAVAEGCPKDLCQGDGKVVSNDGLNNLPDELLENSRSKSKDKRSAANKGSDIPTYAAPQK